MTTASPESARAEFLRRLPDCDYAPPADAVAEAATATGAELPRGEARPDRTTAALVRKFAEDYWRLRPAARRARWDQLRTLPASAAVAARLRGLEAALDAEPAFLADPDDDAVSAFCREQFVRTPRERAVARAKWLADATPQRRAAADRVRRDHPAVMALDPVFEAHSGTGPPPKPASVKQAEALPDWAEDEVVPGSSAEYRRGTPKARPKKSSSRRPASEDGPRQRVQARRAEPRRQPRAYADSGGGSNQGWIVGVVLISVLVAVALLQAVVRSVSTPAGNKYPQFKLPQPKDQFPKPK